MIRAPPSGSVSSVVCSRTHLSSDAEIASLDAPLRCPARLARAGTARARPHGRRAGEPPEGVRRHVQCAHRGRACRMAHQLPRRRVPPARRTVRATPRGARRRDSRGNLRCRGQRHSQRDCRWQCGCGAAGEGAAYRRLLAAEFAAVGRRRHARAALRRDSVHARLGRRGAGAGPRAVRLDSPLPRRFYGTAEQAVPELSRRALVH